MYNMVLKLWWYFYLVMEKTLGRLLLPNSVSLLSCGTWQPESTDSSIHKMTGQFWERQKRISINTNHSYYQCSLPWVSPSWSNDKIRFNFNQPHRRRWGVRLVDVIKHLLHKAPPHEVRLTLLDTLPVFQCHGGNFLSSLYFY